MERLILNQLLLKLQFKQFELVVAVKQGAIGDCVSGTADPCKEENTEEFRDGKRGWCYFIGSESGHQGLGMRKTESVIHRKGAPLTWECAVMGQ